MDIRGWISKDVKWYKFWYPQSGLFGGMLFGAVMVTVAIIVVYCL